jgi:hypothetical protein
MKKQLFLLLSISILLVFVCKAQIPNYGEQPLNIIRVSNGINSAYSLSGLNIKQGTTDYLDQSFYNFPDTKKGATKDVQFVLENISGSIMTITASLIVGNSFTKIGTLPNFLNDGQTVNFTIHYAPTVIRRDTAYLLITTDWSDDMYYQLNLTGNCIAGSGLVVKQGTTEYLDESTYKFPDTKKGTSADVNFILENMSGAAMTITAASMVGNGFSKTGITPGTINNAQQVNFIIRYSPYAIKHDSAYLLITTDNSVDQYYQLYVSGNGLAGDGINNFERGNICKIYPNPVFESAIVKLDLADASDVTFALYNINGQKVFNASGLKANSNFILQRNNLPSGLYQYLIYNDQKGLLTSGKLILE